MFVIDRKDGTVTGGFTQEEKDRAWELIIRHMAEKEAEGKSSPERLMAEPKEGRRR